MADICTCANTNSAKEKRETPAGRCKFCGKLSVEAYLRARVKANRRMKLRV